MIILRALVGLFKRIFKGRKTAPRRQKPFHVSKRKVSSKRKNPRRKKPPFSTHNVAKRKTVSKPPSRSIQPFPAKTKIKNTKIAVKNASHSLKSAAHLSGVLKNTEKEPGILIGEMTHFFSRIIELAFVKQNSKSPVGFIDAIGRFGVGKEKLNKVAF